MAGPKATWDTRPADGRSVTESGGGGAGNPAMQTQRQPPNAEPDSASNVTILAVDDHPVFREALVEIVAAARGFELVGEATSGEGAIRAVDELLPQLVLMDVSMPGMNGIEATRAILKRHPETVVLLISVNDPSLLPGAASLGDAVSCMCKQDLGPSRLRQLWETRVT